MKATPYELVYGQPAQQNIFSRSEGYLHYVEDLVINDEEMGCGVK